MGRKKTERFPERGKRLQTLLTERGMTQKELSQKIHFKRTHFLRCFRRAKYVV